MFQNLVMLALTSAFVGVLPLFIRRRFFAAGVMGAISFLPLWGIYYLSMPTTVWPLFGFPGFCVAVLWVIAAIVDGVESERFPWTSVFPAGYLIFLVGSTVLGSGMLNSSRYASMIGEVENRNWTQDVQPKDPRHMRMVSSGTALYIAQKAVANAGAIGSQFQLDATHMTLQRVKNMLVYVIPFDFAGFSKWTDSAGVPAYIVVDAEDPERQPRLIQLENKALMNYTPAAYFGNNLKRHLRKNGFVGDGLAEPRFELDEEEKVHWVVTTYAPSIQWWGLQVTGVATIDPATGNIARYSVADAPAWIDRIYPVSIVRAYANWWGGYSGGWINSWWGQEGLTQTEDPQLIYGEGDKSEWVIGITSTGVADDSLVGIIYADTRTGKSVFYKTNGGATDEAILEAVNNNQDVLFKKLTGTAPQIYNVYGTMAAVVPLVNPSNAYQGVAIVPLNNVQNVAVGATQSEALRNYQSLIYRTGQQVALNKNTEMKQLTGIVDRIHPDTGSTGSVYLFHIEGVPRIFTASSGEYVKLGLTKLGDTIVVTYVASGEDVVPVQTFDNLSLPLDKSMQQQEIGNAARVKQEADITRITVQELIGRIKNMSPEELELLNKSLR